MQWTGDSHVARALRRSDATVAFGQGLLAARGAALAAQPHRVAMAAAPGDEGAVRLLLTPARRRAPRAVWSWTEPPERYSSPWA